MLVQLPSRSLFNRTLVAFSLGVLSVVGFAVRTVRADGLHAADGSAMPAPYQPPTSPAPPPPFVQTTPPPLSIQTAAAPPTKWYGYQIMLSDLASIVWLGADRQGWAPIGLYAGAPSIVHVVHGNVGPAIASPLLRLGLPLIGGLMGAQVGSCAQSGDECLGGAVLGFGIGALVAMIVDWSVSWSPESVTTPAPSRHPDSNPLLNFASAGVVPTANGASFVLAGHF